MSTIPASAVLNLHFGDKIGHSVSALLSLEESDSKVLVRAFYIFYSSGFWIIVFVCLFYVVVCLFVSGYSCSTSRHTVCFLLFLHAVSYRDVGLSCGK